MALFRREPRDPLDTFEVSPPGVYRRGMFVMLLVLGLFSAASYFSAQDARLDARAARKAAELADVERSLLIRRVDQLLQGQEEAAEEARRSQARNAALERLVVDLLAASDDPAVAEAFREFGRFQAREEQPTPRRADGPRTEDPPPSRPSPQPKPSSRPRPSPKPQPKPSPSPSPKPLMCITLGTTEVCSPSVARE